MFPNNVIALCHRIRLAAGFFRFRRIPSLLPKVVFFTSTTAFYLEQRRVKNSVCHASSIANSAVGAVALSTLSCCDDLTIVADHQSSSALEYAARLLRPLALFNSVQTGDSDDLDELVQCRYRTPASQTSHSSMSTSRKSAVLLMSSSSTAESQMQRELQVAGGREDSGIANNNKATVVFARPPKQASEQDSDISTNSKMTSEVAWLASLALELNDYRHQLRHRLRGAYDEYRRVQQLVDAQPSDGVYQSAVAAGAAVMVQAMSEQAAHFSAVDSSDPSNARRLHASNLHDALVRLPDVMFRVNHDGRLRVACQRIASSLAQQPSSSSTLFLLGKGGAEQIAKEGASLMMRTGRIHAEGYSGGALKHGPFSLIEPQTPVVMIILQDEHRQKMQTAAQEVRARGARTIIITDRVDLADNLAAPADVLLIPSCGTLTSLVALQPIEMMARELQASSVKNGASVYAY